MFFSIILHLLNRIISLFAFLYSFSDETVSRQRDQSVDLVCPIDLMECGGVHSVRWTKGNGGRVAMVSGDGKPMGVMGPYNDR